MINRRQFLLETGAVAGIAGAAAGQSTSRIRRIDIVHHTHLDVGYTDMPSVVRDKQKRYLDTAIDLCLGDKKYRWTVETLVELYDWWQAAAAPRRNQFLGLIRSGQMDAMGLPFNQTPFLNALQWKQMMAWIPSDLWRALNPRAAMQNDVNGFPRAGAMALLDHGIRHLLMGLNADSGGPPFLRPSAFWWKMPDGRRLFVWLGEHYGRAMTYLNAPQVAFGVDEQSVRASHANCAKQLARLESQGYAHDSLILTFTHPAAYDNGSPYPSLGAFIEAWNGLGLQPALRFTTATESVFEMEKSIGSRLPELAGEWTDWWANGDASGPREVAASRYAKRYLAAAHSPAFGPMPETARPDIERILKDLCLFDEHTWGASSSIAAPYSLRTLGQYVEKSELAYRPMTHAEWLLTRRVRTKIDPLPDGVYVVNPAPAEVSGWAISKSGRPRFWVEKLAPHTVRAYVPGTAAADVKPEVKLDSSGWPVSASWPGMRKPLFDGAVGDFLGVDLIPPANRRTITSLHANPDAAKREEIRKQSLRRTAASYGQARLEETPHTWIYTQEIRHPRLANAQRSIELWRREPRARVWVRFDRLSSTDPELFYIDFALPPGTPLPVFSSGGVPFTPYRDQLRGSCRDYFVIDGWAHYRTAGGDWLWATRDAPLVAVGGPHALERHQAEPADTHRIVAMVFDNCWHTNFVADSHGTMDFQFDLAWMDKIAQPADLAEALLAELVPVVNSAVRESPVLRKNVYRP